MIMALSRDRVEALEGSVVVGLGLLGNELSTASNGTAMRANIGHRVNAEPYPVNRDMPSAEGARYKDAIRVLSHATILTGVSSGRQG